MFPISIEGAADIPADGADAALERVRFAVASVGASSIEHQGDQLYFRGPWPTTMRVNPISIFDHCEISVRAGKITYRCSTIHFLIWVTLLVLGFWLIIVSIQPNSMTVLVAICAVLVWVLVFGANYFYGRSAFRSYLATAVQGSWNDAKQ